MSSEGINKFTTSDLAIAAFLATYGYVLSDCKKLEGGKFYFEFSDPDSTARLKSVEFLNSDCCRFDNQVRNLKKLLYKS